LPVYDPESKKLIVRVVYDGPGMAGKTTNLQQISAIFGAIRCSELYSGMTAASRTLYLDWMQLDGGVVCGHDLRCHVLTVPGQAILNRRRQMILSMADSIVFVVDSSEDGLREALPMWRSMPASTRSPAAGVPVLIQANKQDRPGALSVAALRERWKLDPTIPVIAANAASGDGVRETVVLAIRGAAVLLQGELTTTGIVELEGTYETGREIERRIVAAERAQQSSPLDALQRATPPLPSVRSREGDETPPPVPSPRLSGTSERDASGGLIEADEPAHEERVTLPTAEVPRGLVWPAVEGRNTLRQVPFAEAVRRTAKRPSGARGRVGHSEAILFKAGIWCLKTSKKRRFTSAEEARSELSRLAHNKLELGTLCVPRTVLIAQPDPDESYSIWTISPWQTTLANQLEAAAKNQDEQALSDVLSHYARVVVRGLRLCLDSNGVLDLDPRNFALFCEEVFYFDDELPHGAEVPLAGHAMLRRFDEYATYPGALRVYLEILLHELGQLLCFREAEQLNLHHAISKTIVGTDAGSNARSQLSSALKTQRAVAPTSRR
jgi:signal recognition particle receptor subunit beta